MILTVLFYFVLSFNALSVQRGTGDSGGGSAVACFQTLDQARQVVELDGAVPDSLLDSVESLEVLDLYEAKRPRGIDGGDILPLAKIKPDETANAFLKRIVSRFAKVTASNIVSFNPSGELDLYSGLSNRLQFALFSKENIILVENGLKPARDENSETRYVTGRCVLVPLAVQRVAGAGAKLYIDRRLFNHPTHSEYSKAVLLLHEAAYALARQEGAPDSMSTREFVRLMIRDDEMTLSEFIYQACRLGFTSVSTVDCFPTYTNPKMLSELHLVQKLTGAVFNVVGNLAIFGQDIWNDSSFRASARHRTESEILTDSREVLRQSGHGYKVTHANNALIYLRAVKNDSSKSLQRELRELVSARGKKMTALLRDYAKSERATLLSDEGVVWMNESSKNQLAEAFAELIETVAKSTHMACSSEMIQEYEKKELEQDLNQAPFIRLLCFEQLNAIFNSLDSLSGRLWMHHSSAIHLQFGGKDFAGLLGRQLMPAF